MRNRLAVKNGVWPNLGSSAMARSFATRLPVMTERLRSPRVTLRERAAVSRLSIMGRKVLASTKRGMAAAARIGSAMAAARPILTDFLMNPPRLRKRLLQLLRHFELSHGNAGECASIAASTIGLALSSTSSPFANIATRDLIAESAVMEGRRPHLSPQCGRGRGSRGGSCATVHIQLAGVVPNQPGRKACSNWEEISKNAAGPQRFQKCAVQSYEDKPTPLRAIERPCVTAMCTHRP